MSERLRVEKMSERLSVRLSDRFISCSPLSDYQTFRLCSPMAKSKKANSKKKTAAKKKVTPKKVLPMVAEDSWLEPYADDLQDRHDRFQHALKEIQKAAGSLRQFAQAHTWMGIHYDFERKGWWYREWAPAAKALHLIGDFNNWNRYTHSLEKNAAGVWELFIPESDLAHRLVHGQRLMVQVTTAKGVTDRLPAYIRYVVQDPETHGFWGQYWALDQPYQWSDEGFELGELGTPFIYECHVGMAQEREGLGSYREFADKILPRIKALGYNTIQVMAIKEHPYYGSFGYHVSNFFAPSSKFGTPEDLKYMVNKAHQMGIAVIMDVVHSHAVKNHAEGLNDFDGSGEQYFHPGGRGYHEGWDSKLFNYGKWEVKQFLLSNLAYWLEEFHFDGFRFDGVTSMLYFHHGNGVGFGHFDDYFRNDVEWDAITYLQLASTLIHEIKPHAIAIAEDMSGMPGMCRKIADGGIGFDYRLAMGIPDYWIKLLKHKKDEDWNVHDMWHVLNNRHHKEANIAYAESHDQALVGDKTIAFRLMDKYMYDQMQVTDEHPVIDRGIALHKMLRLISASMGGEAYLNFMGNEFGHPEWIDFPREGNNWSYKYARRQWSLVDREDLKYQFLNAFDGEMIKLLRENNVLSAGFARQVYVDEENQILIYERGGLLFIFNFHPTKAHPDYTFEPGLEGEYKIVLNSDAAAFGGHDRVDTEIVYPVTEEGKMRIYVPNRVAMGLKKVLSSR